MQKRIPVTPIKPMPVPLHYTDPSDSSEPTCVDDTIDVFFVFCFNVPCFNSLFPLSDHRFYFLTVQMA